MTTSVYEITTIHTIDGTELEISPLKLKYLKKFMDLFQNVKNAPNDIEAIARIADCVVIAMKQYNPNWANLEFVEDNFDLKTLYQIVDVSAGIKKTGEEQPKEIKSDEESSSWDRFDLAKLEAEIFLTGAWKNYEELETSISLPELLITIEAKRDLDYNEKRFLAGLQGVDLDEQSGKNKDDGGDAWERLKARVASGGAVDDANDILGFQGIRAAQAGFGIGMGLDYGTEI